MLGRLLCGTLFLRLTTEFFFALSLVFAPQRKQIDPTLLGMSLTTLGEVPGSVYLISRVAVARISD